MAAEKREVTGAPVSEAAMLHHRQRVAAVFDGASETYDRVGVD